MREDLNIPPAERVELARLNLAGLWELAGVKSVQYPVQTADLLRLLDAAEYRADPDFVAGLIAQGIVDVPIVDGRPAWGALEVLHVIGQCEGRRRWKWPSTFHAAKFSKPERMQAQAEAEGRASCFHGLEKWDVEALLCLLAGTESAADRETMRVAIHTKLRAVGGIV